MTLISKILGYSIFGDYTDLCLEVCTMAVLAKTYEIVHVRIDRMDGMLLLTTKCQSPVN